MGQAMSPRVFHNCRIGITQKASTRRRKKQQIALVPQDSDPEAIRGIEFTAALPYSFQPMAFFPEDRLIEELLSFFRPHNRIKLPPGDDAMTISEIPVMEMVVSLDAFFEGVHFKRDYMDLGDIGHKSLAAALSDLAATGALPLTYLVNLELPPDLDVEKVKEIYRGYESLNDAYCISPSGGNVVRGDRISLVTTVIGEVEKDSALKRTGMAEGDVVVVTGDLGRPGAALLLYEKKELREKLSNFDLGPIFEKFKKPWPRIKEIQNIKREVNITSIIDISDGLGIDLYRLARLNGFSIVIDESRLPVHPSVVPLLEIGGISTWELISESGEEYELLFTVPEEDVKKLENLQCELTPIGRVVPGFRPRVVLKKKDGGEVDISQRGYDHRRADKAGPAPRQFPDRSKEGGDSRFPEDRRDREDRGGPPREAP